MKKRWIVSGHLLVILLCICAVAYIHIHVRGDKNNRILLEADLFQAVSQYEKHETTCVDFAKVATFAWDKLYIFRPYRSPEEIDRILGTFWLTSRFLIISSSDRVTLFVFMRNGSVVQYLEVPRGVADWAYADNEKGYEFQKSCFVKNERGQMLTSD